VLLFGVCQCADGQLLIVTELCGRGDLRKILEDHSIVLSLPKKLKFAIDIATGMAWMAEGFGETSILHRDLKPANVLVTNEWQCKIADFGLANVKRKTKVYKDTEFLPGSLPYMAPEVFESKELTSALDVYSYAIVLWELYTRETRWYDPILENFENEVCKKGKRPPIQKIQHSEYAQLVVQCWAHLPSQRPIFSQLPGILQSTRVDIFFKHYPLYAKLWRTNWLTEDQVQFKEFAKAIFEISKVQSSDRYMAMLQRIACPLIREDTTLEHSEDYVDIEHFQHMLAWFGGDEKMMQVLIDFCLKEWFFGVITNSDAKQRLKGAPPGTFLIRLNTGQKTHVAEAPYVLSRVDPWTNVIRHTYIQSEGKGHLLARVYVDPDHLHKMLEVRAADLNELLAKLTKVKLTLSDDRKVSLIIGVCPQWPFADLKDAGSGWHPPHDAIEAVPLSESSDSLSDS